MDEGKFFAFDLRFVLSQVGGDHELLREIIAIYAKDYPKKLKDLRKGIEEQDAEGIESAAHAIRGMTANFGAHKAVEAALRLERIGKSGDLSEAENAYTALETELRTLERELAEIGPRGYYEDRS